jgi:DNA-binding MarR family transcriptional regulator
MKLKRSSVFTTDKFFKILYRIAQDSDCNQRELAAALDLSLGGFNYRLRQLIKQRWVNVRQSDRSRNKFGHVYQITTKGQSEISRAAKEYLNIKIQEKQRVLREIRDINRLLRQ